MAKTHAGVNEARVTAFGGATNTWGGALMRLARHDLLPHDGMPDTGWPLSYEELCRHYQNAERELKLPVPDRNGQAKLYVGQPAPFRRRLATVLPSWRKNFARTLGRQLLQRPNVSFMFNAEVAPCTCSAGALQTITAKTPESSVRVAATAFVISAGVVNSTLLARRFPEDARLPLQAHIGRRFHDHISIPLFHIRPASQYRFSKRFSYRFSGTMMYAEHYEAETPASSAQSEAGAFLHFAFDFERSPAIRLLKNIVQRFQRDGDERVTLAAIAGSGTTLAKILAGWCAHGFLYIPEEAAITAVLDLEQVPVEEWVLSTSDSTARLTWDVHPLDLENARRYALASRDLIPQLSAEAGFSYEELFPDPERARVTFDEFVRAKSWDTYHSAGGLCMGRDGRTAPTSPDLLLRGFDNVYVLSTAVFPRVGAANPTLTLLALADRLSQHLGHGRAGSASH
jgi:choline dehydrogenase-like flavoprotein